MTLQIHKAGDVIGRIKLLERKRCKKYTRFTCECILCGTKIITSNLAKTGTRTKCQGCARKVLQTKVGTIVNGRKLIRYNDSGKYDVTCIKCEHKYLALPRQIEHHGCNNCIKIARINNLKDKRYGHLTVIKVWAVGKGDNRKMRVKCRCDCGNVVETTAAKVKSKGVRTCGKKGCRFRCGVYSPHFTGVAKLSGSLFGSYKLKAKVRGIKFEISKEDAFNQYELQSGKCALSGMPIQLGGVLAKTKGQTASLDRIDSSKGYTPDNIQWVHKDINWMKNHYNESYFIEMCKQIVNHQKQKEKENAKHTSRNKASN